MCNWPRQPSSLISCSQASPSRGRERDAGMQGLMKEDAYAIRTYFLSKVAIRKKKLAIGSNWAKQLPISLIVFVDARSKGSWRRLSRRYGGSAGSLPGIQQHTYDGSETFGGRPFAAQDRNSSRPDWLPPSPCRRAERVIRQQIRLIGGLRCKNHNEIAIDVKREIPAA